MSKGLVIAGSVLTAVGVALWLGTTGVFWLRTRDVFNLQTHAYGAGLLAPCMLPFLGLGLPLLIAGLIVSYTERRRNRQG